MFFPPIYLTKSFRCIKLTKLRLQVISLRQHISHDKNHLTLSFPACLKLIKIWTVLNAMQNEITKANSMSSDLCRKTGHWISLGSFPYHCPWKYLECKMWWSVTCDFYSLKISPDDDLSPPNVYFLWPYCSPLWKSTTLTRTVEKVEESTKRASMWVTEKGFTAFRGTAFILFMKS